MLARPATTNSATPSSGVCPGFRRTTRRLDFAAAGSGASTRVPAVLGADGRVVWRPPGSEPCYETGGRASRPSRHPSAAASSPSHHRTRRRAATTPTASPQSSDREARRRSMRTANTRYFHMASARTGGKIRDSAEDFRDRNPTTGPRARGFLQLVTSSGRGPWKKPLRKFPHTNPRHAPALDEVSRCCDVIHNQTRALCGARIADALEAPCERPAVVFTSCARR